VANRVSRRLPRIGLAPAALLLGAVSLEAQSRPMAFERISLEQGLSQASVLCAFQDSRGYVWLGTEDGLNRYDGVEFKTYKYDAADPGSLPNNMVWAIVEDAKGALWVATEGGGLARWERARDRFVRIGGLSGPAPGLSRRLRALLLAPDGALWIGSKDAGLTRLDLASLRTVHYAKDASDPGSLSHDGVHALAYDRSGRLWVGTDGGLNRLDPATGRFERYVHDAARPESLSDDRVRSIVEDRDGRLWVGTLAGLNRREPGGGFRRYRHDPADAGSLSHDRVRAVLEDAAGRLWIGTDGGLDLLDREQSSFLHYRHDAADQASLGDDNVMSLYQDRGKLLWVGTRSAGVHKWNPATWSFGHRTRLASDAGGLREKTVTSFAEDRSGRVWIGTFGGGLHRMDRLTGAIEPYLPRPPLSLSQRVMALATDQRGMLWVGTMDAGLVRLDPATGASAAFRHDPRDPRSLGAAGVMSLAVDGGGQVWVGTYGGGLNRFDPATGGFARYRHDPADPKSLSADIVTSVAEDPSGGLWLGTDGGGLNLLDRRRGEFVHFKHDPARPGSLGSDTIFSLYQDPSGRLWIGTRGAGLAVLEGGPVASARFRHFTQRDGLANDVVYGIQPDGDGQLWLSTNNGLSRFDPSTGSFRNYDASHGLQSNEFNFGAHYRGGSGELFFGGVNGFNAFFPQRLARNDHVPPVVLTAFLKFNRPVATAAPLWQLPGVELGHRDDVVTFEFAALDFAAPRRNRYAYRLEGFDQDWIDLGNLRRVTYTNLPPGSYRFRVRAANNDGVWNQDGLSLPVRVESPPWRRWWAYLGYVLMVGGGLAGFVRAQQRRLEREEEYSRRLEAEVEQRTLELASRNAELEQANQKLVEASLTDSLTGLRNRRFLFECVSKDADLVRRRYLALKQGSPARTFDLSFLMIDLDFFKEINDTCGHAAGDAVLRGVRAVLERSCRSSDVLIRWGGDEFLLVGRDNDAEQVGALAERIRSEIEATAFEVGNGRVAHTTCSIGYACYPFVRGEPDLYQWEDVLGLADAALYAAKGTRNAWVGFLSTQRPPRPDQWRAARVDPKRLIEEGALRAVSSHPELATRGPDAAPQEPAAEIVSRDTAGITA
jgi:diguanylate cyclase (GGDEF)-like protein